jgi:uncharacterized protein YjbI with pentapeptide repeats
MFIVNNVFNYFSNYFIASFGDCPLPRLSGRQKANPVLSDLEKLPNDLLLTIFTKLNAEERENLSQTSTFLANKSISPIILASLFERELVPPHKSLEFAKMAGIFLTKFNSINSKVTDQDLQEIFKVCPNIQQLNLSGCDLLTNAVLDQAPQDLSFYSQLRNTVLGELPKSLQAFILSHYPQKTNEVINKPLQNLQSLDLSDCDWLTDADIEKLPKDLLSLNVSGCTELTDAAIGKLPKGLLSLNVHGCRLTGATMDELPQGLQSLDLSDCYWLTDDVIDKLPQNLKSVNLWKSGLSSAAIRKAAERFEIDPDSRISANNICQIL